MQYKYGMYVKDIAKIKREIVVKKRSDNSIMTKWGITKGQLGFIHDVLLKGQFKEINTRLTNIERGLKVSRDIAVGSVIYSDKFGTGEVTKLFTDGDLMLVKFNSEKLPYMCSRKKMTTVHNNEINKLKLILTA